MSDWIDVNDRLPEPDQFVLAWHEFPDIDNDGLCDGDRYSIVQFVNKEYGFQFYDNGFHGEDITHWKPLEPPEQG